MIDLRAGTASATIAPECGGRVAALVADGTDLVVTGSAADHDMLWGSFPMAPWAGRVAGARFRHDGADHELVANLPPDAAHGTVFDRPWQRTDDGSDPAVAALRCELGPRWPLGGRADQVVRLGAGTLTCTLTVTAGDRAMPVEIGWHTWLRSTGPVDLTASAMYERGPDGLPTGRLVAPAPPPWDDCFVTTAPIHLPVGPLLVTVRSDCDHVVVFDGLDVGIAVEPQSGPPDAFHLRPRVVRAGSSLRRSMTIAWQPAADASRTYPPVTGGR